ncbi:uncharacterized protein Gasu_49130 [Galdieria sulphuraria]|uniref:Uncharacterized protein n=1 Tax=Galdieria sulphuraria TaxID=130081 RepID=M2VW50_GALSU|nr:uncharacterized protein Gasu_49130 [Galdieria sulphuraria]EME27461.1 hypothetical protein Gasu_49130 [Galdieria sulphuraria]|eukprot:XP_005703981.1 hypothetical protein Gasu_49130 [Galdieria sulphuraria]
MKMNFEDASKKQRREQSISFRYRSIHLTERLSSIRMLSTLFLNSSFDTSLHCGTKIIDGLEVFHVTNHSVPFEKQ